MRLGLTQHCQIIHRRPEICIWPQLPAEWTLAFLCIVGGIICLTTTCILLLLSHWHRRAAKYVRWVALFASEWLISVSHALVSGLGVRLGMLWVRLLLIYNPRGSQCNFRGSHKSPTVWRLKLKMTDKWYSYSLSLSLVHACTHTHTHTHTVTHCVTHKCMLTHTCM